MTDNSFSGPMSMVKIDGSKIKLLREQQGLTQLYLATAVEVTTDTISRWENRRYPSIKRDNGVKLAEALNVSLEELLEEPAEEESTTDIPSSDLAAPVDLQETKVSVLKKSWPLLILSGALLSVLLAFSMFFLNMVSLEPFSVKRIVPAHSISDHPFPVIIAVTGAPDDAAAVIIKETLSDNGIILETSPKVNAGGLKNNHIKWLKKVENTALFAYMVKVSGKEQDTLTFSGTAAISKDAETPIDGNSITVLGHHHWADSDKDNIISDEEILAVYEKYGEITNLELDIDQIEEMWMGSEYLWDNENAKINIID